MMKSWITLILILIASLPSLPSIKEGLRFLFPLLNYLFSEFSSAFPATTNTFKDHCILACDGCHVVYTTSSEIIKDFNKPHLIDYKGYNHMHLNGFVDVISKAFIDVVIQTGQKPDERQALHTISCQ